MTFPVRGYVLQFDGKTKKGFLVFALNVSYTSGFFRMEFNRRDLHHDYKQPIEGDRVKLAVYCGQDNLPWYIVDGSLQLICRATTVELVGS